MPGVGFEIPAAHVSDWYRQGRGYIRSDRGTLAYPPCNGM
jgi:hypothetical protein